MLLMHGYLQTEELRNAVLYYVLDPYLAAVQWRSPNHDGFMVLPAKGNMTIEALNQLAAAAIMELRLAHVDLNFSTMQANGAGFDRVALKP